ncbi:MAG: ribosome biogenesis GTPase Der [Synechococcus sp. SB0662_bin_14]|nr:ribosome biogenesis GTPase Der [Synechococcus sp. SB0662_bin_14]
MPLPVVAVVGRPNVGKSTLVNRLAGSRQAIVADQPGITRDRTYQEAEWGRRRFRLVDTGGLVFDDDSTFLPEIREQVGLALAEACAVVMVVDGQQGLTTADQTIASWLRNHSLPVLLAVNKCESPQMGAALAADFWSLGLSEPQPVSSLHGVGTGDLLDQLHDLLPEQQQDQEVEPIQLAIIGRPNVGKSSLLNAVCGESRSIVSPVSGTTRDAIDTQIQRQGHCWRLVDTVGIRRRGRVAYGPEFFGVNRSFKAIARSDVCILVIDALDGITEQDQRLAGRIAEEGRACVVVVNKWDAVDKDTHTMAAMKKRLYGKLYFVDWAPMTFVSARTGQRVERIFSLAKAAVEQHRRRVGTSVVNELLQEALAWRSPPTSRGGRQGRLYYGTQVATQPPCFSLFVNDPKRFTDNYRRYIERQIREGLGFEGSPLRLFWRGKSERQSQRGLAAALASSPAQQDGDEESPA